MKILLLLTFFCSQVQSTDVRLYIFGHSLIDHASGSSETTVPHWMNEMVQASSNSFAVGGQYGFLPTHATPPSSSWGYPGVTAVWDDSTETFAQANIDSILLTAGNFIQYRPANLTYEGPHDTTTPVAETERIFDWVNNNVNQNNPLKYYIYGNWPELNLQSAYPPTPPLQSEVDAFHLTTINEFNDWWLDYVDFVQQSRPLYDIELIPVGPIIAKVLTEIIPNQIPFEDLYEDSAPHGRATIYFLAAMVTYMAIYDENIPSGYMPNTNVHSSVRNNLAQIRTFMWHQVDTVFKNNFE